MSKLADREDMRLRQAGGSKFGKPMVETEEAPFVGDSNEEIQIQQPRGKTVIKEEPKAKKTKKPYDGDFIPPDWKLAKDHHKARIPGPEKEFAADEAVNICDCCGYQVERTRLNMGSSIYEFAFLGSGYPLYFAFIRTTILIIMIFLCISGLYNLASNSLGKDCYSDSEYNKAKDLGILDNKVEQICRRNWITTMSIANKRDNPNTAMIQRILNLISVIVALVACVFWRYIQKVISVKADQRDLACSDYTILVKNVVTGKDFDYDEELKRFFENVSLADLGGKRPNVVKINLVYNLSKQVKKTQDKKKAIKQKQKALLYFHKNGNFPTGVTLESLNREIKTHEDQLEQLEKEYVDGRSKDFAGWAFVSFKTEEQRDALMSQFSVNMKKRALFRMKMFPAKGLGALMFNGSPLFLELPAEPTDVYWDNLHFSTEQKISRRVLSNIFNIGLLVACGVMIYFLTLYNMDLTKAAKESKDEDNAKTNTKAQGLSFLIAVIIAVINYFLTICIKLLADYQKFSTRTSYFIVVGRSLGIAQWLNTAFLTFIVCISISPTNLYGQGGLFYTQSMVFLTNTFIPPILKIINIPYWVKRWMRKRETRKGDKSVFTQDEAQALHEDPDFDISVSYAQIVRNLLFCCWYGPNIPQGLVWTLIAMILLYYVEKYTIIRRSTIKYQIGPELSLEMTDLIEWSVCLFALQSFLSDLMIYKGEKVSSINAITLLVGIFTVAFPFSFCMENIPGPDDGYERKDFDQADELFDTDYARENPATSEPETEKWVMLREHRGLSVNQKKGFSKNKRASTVQKGQLRNEVNNNDVKLIVN